MVKSKSIDESAVIAYYLLPHTLKDTCKFFHIGEKRLKSILDKNGYQARVCGELNQQYHFDWNFFTTQSEDFAYFLGLMGSDGCIAEQSNQIYIELQENDWEVLESLRKSMKLERPIKFYTTKKGYKSAKLYIENKKIKEILCTWGLCPNKTYEIEKFHFPIQLDDIYWKDYIRGYFDGDGCIKRTKGQITFQIDGTNKKLLSTIKKYLEETLQIKIILTEDKPLLYRKNKHDRTVTCYRLCAYGNNANRIFDFIYQQPMKIYMRRKFDKYKEFSNGN